MNRYYVGATSNLEQRLDFHANASPHKYTSKAKDWEVYHVMECETKEQAFEIEKHIKRIKSRVYIENLKKYPEIFEKLVRRYG